MDNYIALIEACMVIHVIATIGVDAWTVASPVIYVATELPMYN